MGKKFINAAQYKIKEIFRLKYASNDTEVNTNDLESDDYEFAMNIFKQRLFVKAGELDEYLKAPTASCKTNVLVEGEFLFLVIKLLFNIINYMLCCLILHSYMRKSIHV